ncbi:Zn-finger containing NTP pyrophosphohydrolase [Saccharomonospora marina XMU15]|uniref:NAD(+) diphosphatase n=1 Tax=Saccharomonospora marina XMU15 TaxID=882083 RepID=H5XAD6_9PSEU|nr:NAD(+) diphosphatase [Saccharomonospora marina]EHR49301.1 Zn-finger containing NTP pyrophosphohydrolase [Saccharomonospora marina XMU15]
MNTAPFQLGQLPALSRSTADRNESLRADAERLLARWPAARVLLLDRRGRTPVPERAAREPRGEPVPLATRKAIDFGEHPPGNAAFLGQWQDTDYWFLPGEAGEDAETVSIPGGWGGWQDAPASEGEVWVDLRGHGSMLDDASAGLLTTAEALRNWHWRARFCSRCGGESELGQFGWVSVCGRCGKEEYPRTDPAVICLVHDDLGTNGEHVLLARQPVWPPKRYSVLAGFVEAGESLEGCVEREIREEVGVDVGDIRYLGSQPWPFPRSIMLGFAARAQAGASLRPADGEIEEALWVPRDEVRAAFAGKHRNLLLPGASSIAHVMLRAWAEANR